MAEAAARCSSADFLVILMSSFSLDGQDSSFVLKKCAGNNSFRVSVSWENVVHFRISELIDLC